MSTASALWTQEVVLKGSHFQPGSPAQDLAKVQLGTEGAKKPMTPKPVQLRNEGLQ